MPHFTFKRKSSAAPATLSGGERRLLPPLPPRRDIPGQLPARHLPEAYALPPPSRRVPPPGMRVPTPDAPAGAGIEGLLEPALDALAYPFGGCDALDMTIRGYVPAIYLFSKHTFLAGFPLTSRPSKLLILTIILALIQTILPAFDAPLDMAATALHIAFMWPHGYVRMHARSFLLAHLVVCAPRLLPSAWLGIQIFHVPSLWLLIATWALFAVSARDTLLEKLLEPLVPPIAHKIRAAADLEAVWYQLDMWKETDPHIIEKLTGAGIAAVFLASIFTQSAAAIAFALTWWVLAVRTILVLDGGQPKLHDPTEQREVAELLPVWTLRIVLHAFETVRFPLIGCLGEKIIGAINVYHAIATAAVLALLVTRNALNYF